jgi:hypothetical protein
MSILFFYKIYNVSYLLRYHDYYYFYLLINEKSKKLKIIPEIMMSLMIFGIIFSSTYLIMSLWIF